MKTPISFFSTFLFVWIMVAPSPASAQVIWQGGAPGQETDWNQPMNWSAHYVPGADDVVVIPDRSTHGSFYPVIDTETAPVSALVVEGGATLTIAVAGKLLIDGANTFNDGILLIGHLVNEGELVIRDVALSAVAGYPDHLYSPGAMMVSNSAKPDTEKSQKAPQSYSWATFSHRTIE